MALLDENPGEAAIMQAGVNTKDNRGQTPLHSSIFSGDVNITKVLLERYAEINSQDDEGKTPMHLACMLGNLSMVKLLLGRTECVVTVQD